jgi:hypothetical protein
MFLEHLIVPCIFNRIGKAYMYERVICILKNAYENNMLKKNVLWLEQFFSNYLEKTLF